jgi:hypothetical protein
MPEHPKHVGDRTTLAVMLSMVDAGLEVSVPFGENCRYDLVLDDGSRLSRVQCKTGRLRDGTVRFSTASTYGHLPSPRQVRRPYAGEIDAFAVYCPDTAGVYLVPIEQVGTRSGAYLRVTRPRNGQRERIRVASEFEVATVACAQVQRSSQLAVWESPTAEA